jgi:hypothetical protein
MPAISLINRLDHCRKVRDGEWIARCPAHDDRSPSLSIKDEGDGRTLIHCFAGCGANEILKSVGMELQDLYPPTDKNYHAERQFKERTIDELVVDISIADMNAGKRLSEDDKARCRAALHRIDNDKPSPRNSQINQRGFIEVGKREATRIAKKVDTKS